MYYLRRNNLSSDELQLRLKFSITVDSAAVCTISIISVSFYLKKGMIFKRYKHRVKIFIIFNLIVSCPTAKVVILIPKLKT